MIRRPPRSTLSSSSAASDVYKRQGIWRWCRWLRLNSQCCRRRSTRRPACRNPGGADWGYQGYSLVDLPGDVWRSIGDVRGEVDGLSLAAIWQQNHTGLIRIIRGGSAICTDGAAVGARLRQRDAYVRIGETGGGRATDQGIGEGGDGGYGENLQAKFHWGNPL